MQFETAYFLGFPNVVGAIDCMHIPLAAPNVNAEQYVNRKGDITINTQLVVNHRGAITNVVARWPGSIHDSRILQESRLQHVLENHMLGPYFLIGDCFKVTFISIEKCCLIYC